MSDEPGVPIGVVVGIVLGAWALVGLLGRFFRHRDNDDEET